MSQLDASIAQLVIPDLEHAFAASVVAVGWVALAYLLTLAALLPVFGRLADVFGRTRLYTLGFAIFVAGSAACGFAPSLGALVAARVLQAAGAALLQANSVAIVVSAAGPARRGKAIGIQATAQAAGLSVGPALGGFLIHALGWRWVFWINVPAGVVGIALALAFLPRGERARGHGEPFDWVGAATLGPALTALLLALSFGFGWGLGSPRTLGTLAAAVVLLVVFIRRERRFAYPLVSLRLFADRAFAAGNTAGFFSYAVLFGTFFVVPFALERGYGESPLDAGLRLTLVPLALALVAPLAGGLSDRLGSKPLALAGALTTTAALVLAALAFRAPGSDLVRATIALALLGAGQGLFTAPNNSAIMASATPATVGAAGGILNVMRSLGTSFGVAAASAAFALFSGGHAASHAATILDATHRTFALLAALSCFGALAVAFGPGRTTALGEDAAAALA